MTLKIQAIRFIVCDFFQTLATEHQSVTDQQEVADFLSVPYEDFHRLAEPCNELMEVGAMSMVERMRLIFKYFDTVSMEKIVQAIQIERAAFCRVIDFYDDSVPETLKLLSKNYSVTVCSNANWITVTALDHLIGSYVKKVAVSCRQGYKKTATDPRLFLDAIPDGLRPDQGLFVGDGGSGELQGAKSLGMQTVLVLSHDGHALKHPEEQVGDHADAIIDSVNALPRLLGI